MIKIIKNFKWFFTVSFLCVFLGIFTFITFINQNFIFLNENNLPYFINFRCNLFNTFSDAFNKGNLKAFSQYYTKKTGSKLA